MPLINKNRKEWLRIIVFGKCDASLKKIQTDAFPIFQFKYKFISRTKIVSPYDKLTYQLEISIFLLNI